MNFEAFMYVAIVSIAGTFLWQMYFYVLPAYKKALIAESLVSLASGVKRFNQKALGDGEVKKGSYLHDKLYRVLYSVLIHKTDLRFKALSHVRYDEETEKGVQKIRQELDALDEETKCHIYDAIYAMSKILIIRNPVVFLMICIKTSFTRKSYYSEKTVLKSRCNSDKSPLKKRMVLSAEFITVNAKDEDYVLAPC